jgi:hypothetical protein
MKKKKNKKINHLSLRECEAILERAGGTAQCLYIQQILLQRQILLAKKKFKD